MADRRALPGTVVPWSPDFPRRRQVPAAAARPSGNRQIVRSGHFWKDDVILAQRHEQIGRSFMFGYVGHERQTLNEEGETTRLLAAGGDLLAPTRPRPIVLNVYCGLGSNKASSLARHSPSIIPSIMSGRNRR